jgi:hypothetical protein
LSQGGYLCPDPEASNLQRPRACHVGGGMSGQILEDCCGNLCRRINSGDRCRRPVINLLQFLSSTTMPPLPWTIGIRERSWLMITTLSNMGIFDSSGTLDSYCIHRDKLSRHRGAKPRTWKPPETLPDPDVMGFELSSRKAVPLRAFGNARPFR